MKFSFFVIFVLVLSFPIKGYALDQMPAAYPFPWDFSELESAPIQAPPFSEITGLLVPHHMVVRKKVFEAYQLLAGEQEQEPEVVIILSPNHYELGKANIQMNSTGFRTRFGELLVDEEVEKFLDIPINNFPFYNEHGISAHVNFIRYFFPTAKIVPIILKWDTPMREIEKLAKKIALLQKRVLIIASIDFSHYQPQKVADFHDLLAQSVIEHCDTKRTSKLEIDSRASLSLFLRVLKKKDACSSWIMSHTNSQAYTSSFLSSTTSHFIALFGPSATKPPRSSSKIRGLYTVIHELSDGIAGEEDRYFMGNDEIFLSASGVISHVDMKTKRLTGVVEDKTIIQAVTKGEEVCKGGDFGITRGEMLIHCF